MQIKGVRIKFQTEGYWAGMPTVFVDCFGCTVGCKHCDEPYSGKYQSLPVDKIYELIEVGMKNFQMPFVAIGGGEPTDQGEELTELIEIIKTKNKQTEILLETCAAGKTAKKLAHRSGLLANIWLCVSPVSHKEPNKTLITRANELKLLVSDTEKSVKFCRMYSSIASPLSKLRYQPVFSRHVNFERAMENCFCLAREFGGRISVQWHRFLDLEKLNLNKELIK
jgi:organic radical activating enzyme